MADPPSLLPLGRVRRCAVQVVRFLVREQLLLHTSRAQERSAAPELAHSRERLVMRTNQSGGTLHKSRVGSCGCDQQERLSGRSQQAAWPEIHASLAALSCDADHTRWQRPATPRFVRDRSCVPHASRRKLCRTHGGRVLLRPTRAGSAKARFSVTAFPSRSVMPPERDSRKTQWRLMSSCDRNRTW